MQASFIADVHLGRLARLLRLLGFDALYRNDFTRRELTVLAQTQNRFLLSRDVSFAANPFLRFVWIEKEEAYEQAKQVIRQLQLSGQFYPFTRCMSCSGILQQVAKENIVDQLKENTTRHYHEFWQCNGCSKLYWKGSHYKRMQDLLQQLR